MTQLEEIAQLKKEITRLKTERIEMFERLAQWHGHLAQQYRSIVDVYTGNTVPIDEVIKRFKENALDKR